MSYYDNISIKDRYSLGYYNGTGRKMGVPTWEELLRQSEEYYKSIQEEHEERQRNRGNDQFPNGGCCIVVVVIVSSMILLGCGINKMIKNNKITETKPSSSKTIDNGFNTKNNSLTFFIKSFKSNNQMQM